MSKRIYPDMPEDIWYSRDSSDDGSDTEIDDSEDLYNQPTDPENLKEACLLSAKEIMQEIGPSKELKQQLLELLMADPCLGYQPPVGTAKRTGATKGRQKKEKS